MNLRPGTQIGPYTLTREIARGGQGAVFEATGRKGTPVALKLLLDDDEEACARFLREAETLSRLDHPNLIKALDQGQTPGGVAYLALSLVRGQSLSEWVRSGGPPAPDEALRVMADAAEALDYCHEQGLVHRDLKPQNILLEAETGRVVVVDFGLVRRSKLALAWSTQDRASLTQEGAVLGTPAYMPPEQISPEFGGVDRRSDVYGLGATLFFLLTGEAPFKAPGGVLQLLTRVASDPPTDPRALRPDLPAHLAELCLRSLAKDPAQRPSTALEFGAALRSPVETKGDLLLGSLALAGLILVGLALGGAVLALSSPEAPSVAEASSQTPQASRSSPEPSPTPLEEVTEETLVLAERLLAEEDAAKRREGEVLLRELVSQGSPRAAFLLGRYLLEESPAAGCALLQKAAQGGSPGAMFNLGVLHQRGDEVPEDMALARDWYLRAASKGHSKAMLNLGFLLLHGKGGPPDEAEAIPWLQRSADEGEVGAMILLGQLHARGSKVTPKDFSFARTFFERAAAAGSLRGMCHLALLCAKGQGGPQDWKRSSDLFRRAAQGGETKAYLPYAEALLLGRGIAQDSKLALEWFLKAGAEGDTGAIGRAGSLCLKGAPGLPPEPKRGTKFLRQAANKGDLGAMFALGRAFLDGKGVGGTAGEGLAWLERAAKAGHAPAMTSYAHALTKGSGGRPANSAEGLVWLERAAKAGYPPAMGAWGSMLVTEGDREGYDLIERAAKRGDPESMLGHGVRYLSGKDLPRWNPKLARKWLDLAAKSQHERIRRAAQDALRRLDLKIARERAAGRPDAAGSPEPKAP